MAVFVVLEKEEEIVELEAKKDEELIDAEVVHLIPVVVEYKQKTIEPCLLPIFSLNLEVIEDSRDQLVHVCLVE